eukprot:2154086-Amphidinium_carterae.1
MVESHSVEGLLMLGSVAKEAVWDGPLAFRVLRVAMLGREFSDAEGFLEWGLPGQGVVATRWQAPDWMS